MTPVDRFRKIREKSLRKEYFRKKREQKTERLLHKSLRKCPSCAKEGVGIRIDDHNASKVWVACIACGLNYTAKFRPAYEDVDYYNEMLDWFRRQARQGLVPIIDAGLDLSSELVIMDCPECKLGKLILKRNRWGGPFVGCTDYRTRGCTALFQLPRTPHIWEIRLSRTKCPSCGWPRLEWHDPNHGLLRLGATCFNPNCSGLDKRRSIQSNSE